MPQTSFCYLDKNTKNSLWKTGISLTLKPSGYLKASMREKALIEVMHFWRQFYHSPGPLRASGLDLLSASHQKEWNQGRSWDTSKMTSTYPIRRSNIYFAFLVINQELDLTTKANNTEYLSILLLINFEYASVEMRTLFQSNRKILLIALTTSLNSPCFLWKLFECHLMTIQVLFLI